MDRWIWLFTADIFPDVSFRQGLVDWNKFLANHLSLHSGNWSGAITAKASNNVHCLDTRVETVTFGGTWKEDNSSAIPRATVPRGDFLRAAIPVPSSPVPPSPAPPSPGLILALDDAGCSRVGAGKMRPNVALASSSVLQRT